MISSIVFIVLTILNVSLISSRIVDIPKTKARYVHTFNIVNKPTCTAFQVNLNLPQDYYITNNHCCQSVRDLPLSITVDNSFMRVVKVDERKDLCLMVSLSPKDESNGGGIIMSETPSRPMDKIFTIGFPAHYGKTIREGRTIDQMKYDFVGVPVMNTTISILGGASGSPVMNMDGELVGVMVMMTHPTFSQFIPLYQIKEFIKDVK